MSELIRKIDILMNGVSMSRVESVREIRDEVASLESELKEREWISVEDENPPKSTAFSTHTVLLWDSKSMQPYGRGME